MHGIVRIDGPGGGGTLIRHARTRVAISQAELARRIGVSRQVVHRWESRDREPSFENVLRAIGACGWDLVAYLELRDEFDGQLRLPIRRRPTPPSHPARIDVLPVDGAHAGERRLQGLISMRRRRAARRATGARHDRRRR